MVRFQSLYAINVSGPGGDDSKLLVRTTSRTCTLSRCTFLPPLTYQWCWWLELHVAPLLASWGVAPKTYSFVGAGLSPHEVRTGYEGTQQTAIFCADYTSEAVSSQSVYFGAASLFVLIFVRTYGAFV